MSSAGVVELRGSWQSRPVVDTVTWVTWCDTFAPCRAENNFRPLYRDVPQRVGFGTQARREGQCVREWLLSDASSRGPARSHR